MWSIARVIPYPGNPRKIPESAVDKVATSITDSQESTFREWNRSRCGQAVSAVMTNEIKYVLISTVPALTKSIVSDFFADVGTWAASCGTPGLISTPFDDFISTRIFMYAAALRTQVTAFRWVARLKPVRAILAGILLPSLNDAINVSGIDLHQPCLAAFPFTRNLRASRSAKQVQDEVAPLACCSAKHARILAVASLSFALLAARKHSRGRHPRHTLFLPSRLLRSPHNLQGWNLHRACGCVNHNHLFDDVCLHRALGHNGVWKQPS
jgi:hypothetical protein